MWLDNKIFIIPILLKIYVISYTIRLHKLTSLVSNTYNKLMKENLKNIRYIIIITQHSTRTIIMAYFPNISLIKLTRIYVKIWLIRL